MSDADDDRTATEDDISFDENPNPADPNQIPVPPEQDDPLGPHEVRDIHADNLAHAPNEPPPGNPATYSGPAGAGQDGSSSEPSTDPVETPSDSAGSAGEPAVAGSSDEPSPGGDDGGGD
jgi:hypothetical protein